MDREECLRIISPGGVGRIGFLGAEGPTVLPVNYRLHEGAIIFRTAFGGPINQDLRSGIEGAEIKVAFQVDHIDEAEQGGWSVCVRGPVRHVTPPEELPGMTIAGVEPWAGGERELDVRIVPQQITGRRITS